MTGRPWMVALVLLSLAMASAPLPALAESRRAESVTPIALSLRASEVAVMSVSRAKGDEGEHARRLTVVESLSGDLEPGESVSLRTDSPSGGWRVAPGTKAIVFLRGKGADGAWRTVGGPDGFWPLDTGAESTETMRLAKTTIQIVREDEGFRESPRLRAALVRGVDRAIGKASAGAALDLLRHPGMTARLTGDESQALLASFARFGNRHGARAPLARVLGREKVEGAAPLLVAAVFEEGSRDVEAAVGEALGALDDGEILADFAARAATLDGETRRRVATVLSASGHESARPTLESMLVDQSTEVREIAILGLGAQAYADSVAPLARRLTGSPRERVPVLKRALAWALSKCDTPEGWTALEKAADSDRDTQFRKWCERLRKRPPSTFVR